MSRLVAVALLPLALLLQPSAVRAQDCSPSTDLGNKCTPYVGQLHSTACFRPGSIFVRKAQWEPAQRTTIAYSGQKRVDFFYVVDSRRAADSYGALFVGIVRVFGQRVSNEVKLTQNQEFKFKKFEKKNNYSAGLKPGGFLTQPMRQWGKLPQMSSVFISAEPNALPKFDFPRATGEQNYIPHARFYRFETGKITCVPFRVGMTSDVDVIFGTIVDQLADGHSIIQFRVTVER